MMQKVVILKSAEMDLLDLKAYLIKNFGKASWQNSYGNIKAAIRQIQHFPNHGKVPEELVQLHLVQYRQVLSGMNRIIYELRESTIFIHIICDVRRDLGPVLNRRLLRVAN